MIAILHYQFCFDNGRLSIYKDQISHDIIHVLQSVVFSIINCHFVITKLIKEKPLQNIVLTPEKKF
jgi:hypothetical protein